MPPPLRLAIVNDFEIVVAGIAKIFADDPRVDVLELDHRNEVRREVDIVLADMFTAVPGDGVDLEDLVRPFDTEGDLLERLQAKAAAVRKVVPDCVGLSVTAFQSGVTFTLVATDETVVPWTRSSTSAVAPASWVPSRTGSSSTTAPTRSHGTCLPWPPQPPPSPAR